MTVRLDHTIVWSQDQHEAATFLADVLGAGEPASHPPFSAVVLGNGVTLDFLTASGAVAPQHYAFRVDDAEFDRIMARITDRGLPYWGGPGHSQAGRVNRLDGGRGVYFDDPSGHSLEAITVPDGA